MKINIDLKEAFGFGGITNYKRNISLGISKFSDVKLVGCYNWSRLATKDKYTWFNGKLNKSIIPDQLVYKFAEKNNWNFPFSYEIMMNSQAELNLFLTYRIPHVTFKAPLISAIHDIILLKTNAESDYAKEEHEAILRNTISKSHQLLTVSESAKSDIVDYFNINPDNVHIVHNGIDHHQFEEELSPERRLYISNKYNLPDKFILYFGGYRAHKNIERLLAAYSLLSSTIRKDLKLVITNRNQKLQKLAADLKISEDVIFTAFIDESDKCAIYKSAYMVYYASLYEGFGVPILEAQMSKVPVITSNTSSLPEASGGFAELVNPCSVDEIYCAMMELISDSAKRNYLVQNGYNNALQYTWERGAKELHDVLMKLI